MTQHLVPSSNTHPSHDDSSRRPAPTPAFPGPVITAVCMIVAPLALAVLCLMATGIYKFHGRDFLAAMAAHPVRTEVFLNAVPIGIFLLMLAVMGLAAMAVPGARRLARLGGSSAVLGLCGPLFFVAIEYCGYQLSSPKHLAAGAYMYDQANTVPRISLNISGLAIIFGFIALAVAAHRSGVLSKVAAVCFGCTALLPIGFIGAFLPISAVGFIGCAIALLPLGRSLLHGRDDESLETGVGAVAASAPARADQSVAR